METLTDMQEKIANAVQETAYVLRSMMCRTAFQNGQKVKKITVRYESRKREVVRQTYTYPATASISEMYSRIPMNLRTSNSLCAGN